MMERQQSSFLDVYRAMLGRSNELNQAIIVRAEQIQRLQLLQDKDEKELRVIRKQMVIFKR